MVHSSLENRLHSRTHVTAVMFQNAWCFEDSAPFPQKCCIFELSERVGFEESETFLYTCHNFGKLIEKPMTCWLKNLRDLKHF